MTSVFVLGMIFALGLFVSHIQVFQRVRMFTFSSIAILAGALFSSNGLLPLLSSTKQVVSSSVLIAIFWLFVVDGSRFFFDLTKIKLQRIWFLCAALAFVALYTLLQLQNHSILEDTHLGLWSTWLLGTIMLSTIFSRLSVYIAILFFPFIYVLENGINFQSNIVFLLSHFLIGIILAFVARLLLPSKNNDELDTPQRLTFLGLCVLAIGWANGLNLFAPLVGFCLGVFLTLVKRPILDQKLLSSEAALYLLVAVVAGTYLHFDLYYLLYGFGFLLIRSAGILAWTYYTTNKRFSDSTLNYLPFEPLAIAVLLALFLALPTKPIVATLFQVACYFFVLNDLLCLIVEFATRDKSGEDLDGGS